MRERLARLAPEEIVGIALLAVVLVAVAVDPRAVGRILESPYATPAPESGAAAILRQSANPSPRPSPFIIVTDPRVIRVPPNGGVTYQPRMVTPELQSCWEAAMAAIRAGGQPVVCALPSPAPPAR